LYAATSAGIAVLDGASWRVVTGSETLNVLGMTAPGAGCARALFVTPDGIGVLDTAGDAYIVAGAPGYILSCVSPGGEFLGSANGGALAFLACPGAGGTAGVTGVLLPPGPFSSKFVSVAVDDNGWLWAGTGSRNGEGFMSFDGNRWRSYTSASYPGLGNDEYYIVATGPGNIKYISSWGGGLAVVNGNNDIERVLNTSDGLQPTLSDPSFVVVGGVATDRSGVTWVTPRTPPGDTSLVRLHADGNLGYLTGCVYDLPPPNGTCITRTPLRIFTDVVIDDYGTKWLANYSRFEPVNPIGFYYYNESRTLPGTRGGWGKMTTDDGLRSNFVWSLAIDRYGDLWVGSDQGITIMYNTLNPHSSMAAYHPLSDQIIQDMVVDPMNRKWVATKRGVFLMSQDGTTILENYTVGNTGGKLLDDDVASIALDPSTGTVYFGTEKGLSALTTASVAPARTFSELKVYPNPFEVPSPRPATIGGLVEDSYLKIFTVSGALVRELNTPGGGIGTWDGTDDANRPVSSGVYVIVAYSQDGTEVGSAKVAVIRN
ncbi:MAG TPA: two-component regulator propeller domain-containing protein, partial [Bacteroidota bacterium]|nr:two-component regulator propeller domain-containing protein [Bacteroidota bacterium]